MPLGIEFRAFDSYSPLLQVDPMNPRLHRQTPFSHVPPFVQLTFIEQSRKAVERGAGFSPFTIET